MSRLATGVEDEGIGSTLSGWLSVSCPAEVGFNGVRGKGSRVEVVGTWCRSGRSRVITSLHSQRVTVMDPGASGEAVFG